MIQRWPGRLSCAMIRTRQKSDRNHLFELWAESLKPNAECQKLIV